MPDLASPRARTSQLVAPPGIAGCYGRAATRRIGDSASGKPVRQVQVSFVAGIMNLQRREDTLSSGRVRGWQYITLQPASIAHKAFRGAGSDVS